MLRFDVWFIFNRQVFHKKMQQKFIVKSVRLFITNCGDFITKCNSHYKIRRLLQIAIEHLLSMQPSLKLLHSMCSVEHLAKPFSNRFCTPFKAFKQDTFVYYEQQNYYLITRMLSSTLINANLDDSKLIYLVPINVMW